MIALPTWAATPEARELIAAIVAERPDCWMLKRWAWTNCREPKFKGANARALRALWDAQCDAAMEANDRPLYLKLHAAHPDDLIDKLLAEAERADLEPKELPGGRFQVAA